MSRSSDKLKNKLSEHFGSRCLFDEELKPYTSYRIGGAAEILVFPETVSEWRFVSDICRRGNVSLTILGLGSNVLISDKGVRGVTASTVSMKGIGMEGDVTSAKAGEPWDDLVKFAIENGFGGLEKTSAVPGSVGGAVVMNAGAYGQETFDYLLDFDVLDRDGCVKTLPKSDVKYSYRKVEGIEDLLILSARWRLPKRKQEELAETRRAILAERAASQPLDYPSAGSVFKRPHVDYASRLIDKAGLKGYTIGDAQVSKKHAGFIVNLGSATASDVYRLINLIKHKVKSLTGIELELEQKLLGEF
jgi:UDP-N-acetylmuramate dehydrogenase